MSKVVLFIALCLCIGVNLQGQQCSLTLLNNEEIEIGDFDTISLRFYVSEADDVDLAGFQSICAVRLLFEHQQLSDITMTLTSPFGNEVTLIGPALENRTQFSVFPIEHDLTFLPTADPDVSPQPPLDVQWTNDLFNIWERQSFWGGTYYPFLGDFGTELDVGPVVGIWELTIIDHFLNAQGKLTGFEITFCEEDGLVCDVCEATAGQFAVQDTQFLCRNDFLDLSPLFDIGPSDPNLYDDSFFVFDEDGNPVAQGASPDFTSLPSGIYTAYGLTLLTSQADTALSGLADLQRDVLLDNVEMAGGFLCIDISDPLVINLSEPILSSLPIANLCVGESVTFAGQTISASGTFMDTIGRCDTIETLIVRSTDLQASFSNDTLYTDCMSGLVTFGPDISGGVGVINYSWRETRGSGVSGDSSLTFSAAADWELSVSDDICEIILDLVVVESGVGFSVTLEADPPSFNCQQTVSEIRYIPTFPVDSVLWFRDGDFLTRGDPFIVVDDESLYSVEVYGGNGCVLTESLMLESDFEAPSAVVNIPEITCTNLGVLAEFTTTSNFSRSIWINDEGDTISMGIDVAISEPGFYDLVLVGDNLCETTISFEATTNALLPEIEDVPEGELTLTCATPSISISPDIEADVIESFWIFGVDDTIRNMDDIVISEANLYRFVAVGSNGCIASRRIDVSVDTIKPIFQITPDSITCDRPDATIMLRGISEDESVSFDGDNITARTDTSVTVDDVGMITITVVNNANQCMTIETFEVRQDGSVPSVTLGGTNEITCTQPEVDLTSTFDGMIPSIFYWLSPDGDTLREQSIVVRDTGIYVFEALGANGCLFSDDIVVSESMSIPSFDVPSTYATTCDNRQLDIAIEDLTLIDSVIWILGPDTIRMPRLNVTTLERSVEVIVIGNNGCSTGQVIDITYDTLMPVFNLMSDTLDCQTDRVEITTDVVFSNHTFVWAGDDVASLTTSSVTVQNPGAYALNVTDNTTGCTGLMTLDVMSNFDEPTFTSLTPDTITCNQTSVDVSISTAVSNLVMWTTSDGREVEGPKILAGSRGIQKFEVVGDNGCSIQDSIEVFDNLQAPEVILETRYELSCIVDQVIISPEFVGPVSSLLWSFDDGSTSSGFSEVITDNSLESLTVVGANGCQEIIDFDITIANDIPQAVITSSDTLVCSGAIINLNSSALVSSNHRPIWFRDEVLLTTDDLSIPAEVSGDYILQVVDTISGCESMDTIEVIINPSPFEQLEFVVMDESCEGAMDGFINVSDVLGGQGSTLVSIEGSLVDINQDNAIEPGSYTIMAEDELGCMIDSMATVQPGGFINVDLGENIRVERGEKVTIIPRYMGDNPVTVSWSGDQGTTSTEIDTLCFIPLLDEQIRIVASNGSGCEAIDSILITVFVDVSKIKAYIPNILSLSNTRGNNVVRLSLPPDIVEVTDLSIYDRWGQRVMYVPLVSGGENVIVWDGRFNNTPVASGVYVYTYEMLTIHDERVRRRSGDITVID